jgi:hypothetical protein
MTLNADLAGRPDQVLTTIAHEVMHWTWAALPREARKRIKEHLRSRSEDTAGFRRHGVDYVGGDWIAPLAGRADGTEILPYYFEALFGDASELAQHLTNKEQRATFNLVADVLQLKNHEDDDAR